MGAPFEKFSVIIAAGGFTYKGTNRRFDYFHVEIIREDRKHTRRTERKFIEDAIREKLERELKP